MLILLVPLTVEPMRIKIFCCFVWGLIALAQGAPSWAEPVEAEQAELVAAAARELEVARLERRRYVNVDYPLQMRRLESAITFARAEVKTYQARIAEYSQFDKWVGSAPLFNDLQNARLALLEAELRLKDLEKERCLIQRNHSDQLRLFQLRLEAAEAHLASLRAAP